MNAVSVDAPSCRVCRQGFLPRSSMQAVCSLKCTLIEVRVKKTAEKDDRKATKAKLEALKPRSHWLRLAQAAFNGYIRTRDAALPCISCGRHHGGQWHAGHYLTVGARPELRFDEDNVHKQCAPCNDHLHGNLVLYRVGLLARIGAERVALLEGPHAQAKWSVDELKAIRRKYAEAARALQSLLSA